MAPRRGFLLLIIRGIRWFRAAMASSQMIWGKVLRATSSQMIWGEVLQAASSQIIWGKFLRAASQILSGKVLRATSSQEIWGKVVRPGIGVPTPWAHLVLRHVAVEAVKTVHVPPRNRPGLRCVAELWAPSYER
jgi:hypothetical protein